MDQPHSTTSLAFLLTQANRIVHASLKRLPVAQYHDAIDPSDRRAEQLKRPLGTLIREHD